MGVIPYFVYILIRGLLKSEQKVWRVVVNAVISVIFFFSVKAFVKADDAHDHIYYGISGDSQGLRVGISV